jgi:hypothetical protein
MAKIDTNADYNSQNKMKRQRDEKEVKDGKEEKSEKKQKEDEEKEKKKKEENIIKTMVENYFDESVKLDKSAKSLSLTDVKSLKSLCSSVQQSLNEKIAVLKYTAKIKLVFKNTKNDKDLFPWKEEWLCGIEKWLNSVKVNKIVLFDEDDEDDVKRAHYFLTLGPNVRMNIHAKYSDDGFDESEIYSLLNPKKKSKRNIKRKDKINGSTLKFRLKTIFLYWYKELFPKADLFSKDILYTSDVPPFNMWVEYMVELLHMFTAHFYTIDSECEKPTAGEINSMKNCGLPDYSTFNSNVIWIPTSFACPSSLIDGLIMGARNCCPPSWVRVPNVGELCNAKIIYSDYQMDCVTRIILGKIVLGVFFDKEINTRKLKFDIGSVEPVLIPNYTSMKIYPWEFAGFNFLMSMDALRINSAMISLSIDVGKSFAYDETVDAGGLPKISNHYNIKNAWPGRYSTKQIVSFAKWFMLTTLEIDTILGRCSETREKKETKILFEKDYLLKHTSIGRSTIHKKEVENLVYSQLPKDVGNIILGDYFESFDDQPPDNFFESVQELFFEGMERKYPKKVESL